MLLPEWHERAWTLQEELLASGRVYYLRWFGDMIVNDQGSAQFVGFQAYPATNWWLRDGLANNAALQTRPLTDFVRIANVQPGLRPRQNRLFLQARHLALQFARSVN